MLGQTLHDKIHGPEFQPFTLVLANGEKIEVQYPDSLTLASIVVGGKRIFASSITVLETKGNEVIERVISLPLIAQVVNRFGMNGH